MPPRADAHALFVHALDTINAALDAHGDAPPYAPLLTASEQVLGEREIGVAVYDPDPARPFDYFTVRFRGGRFELVPNRESPDVCWMVSRDYLETVAADPQPYIEDPAKLDWEWLESRVGLRAS